VPRSKRPWRSDLFTPGLLRYSSLNIMCAPCHIFEGNMRTKSFWADLGLLFGRHAHCQPRVAAVYRNTQNRFIYFLFSTNVIIKKIRQNPVAVSWKRRRPPLWMSLCTLTTQLGKPVCCGSPPSPTGTSCTRRCAPGSPTTAHPCPSLTPISSSSSFDFSANLSNFDEKSQRFIIFFFQCLPFSPLLGIRGMASAGPSATCVAAPHVCTRMPVCKALWHGCWNTAYSGSLIQHTP
jgi:hypothetical protein